MRQQGKPKGWTGTIEYHGFKIVVSRPKSYTWEQNNQIQDANLDYYKRLHGYYTQLQENVKEARADLKREAEKLAKAHPDSESIKVGFRLAILPWAPTFTSPPSTGIPSSNGKIRPTKRTPRTNKKEKA